MEAEALVEVIMEDLVVVEEDKDNNKNLRKPVKIIISFLELRKTHPIKK